MTTANAGPMTYEIRYVGTMGPTGMYADGGLDSIVEIACIMGSSYPIDSIVDEAGEIVLDRDQIRERCAALSEDKTASEEKLERP
jgi:hypothetical protein